MQVSFGKREFTDLIRLGPPHLSYEHDGLDPARVAKMWSGTGILNRTDTELLPQFGFGISFNLHVFTCKLASIVKAHVKIWGVWEFQYSKISIRNASNS